MPSTLRPKHPYMQAPCSSPSSTLQRIPRPINHICRLSNRPGRLLPIALRNRISHEWENLRLQCVFLGRREDDVFELFAAGELHIR
jgi:hypothetical protein